MSAGIAFLIPSILMLQASNAFTACPNGYRACVEVTNNCGAPLYLQRTILDGDDAWPINTPSQSASITTLTNGGKVVLDITEWGKHSAGQRLYAWWKDPRHFAYDPMTHRDKVEINYDGGNTMYYNPTGVDNFGLPVYIGPYNEADCQSGATTGFGSIKIGDIASQCPYSYISTPPFGVCQSPRLVCIADASNPICSELNGLISQCINTGDCGAGTTTPNVWGCNGPMAQNPKYCSALHRGIYNFIKNGGNEADKNQYYKTSPYNKYAAFIHSSGAKHYAYPYDDYPSTLNEGGYIQCTNLRYMKVQFCPSDGSGSGGGSCGNIPSACSGDITWAVNTGSKTNPEWYPNFADKTGVQLSSATEQDMIVYWVCSDINPNGNCGGLQLPCGRNCGGSGGGGCGNIPSTCNGDIDWAVNTGSKSHPEWYPNFRAKTGVELSSATREDMIVYWVCSGINPNGNCNDLELPCGRSCGAGDISAAAAVPAAVLNSAASGSVFGMNIYATDKNFNINMIEDMILNKGVYHFRAFKSWGRPSAVTNMLNKYAHLGTSLLFNIEWGEDCNSFKSLISGYNFDIIVQIDSCGWPDCINPTEGGFCQGSMKSNVNQYITKLNSCNSALPTNVEFVIPWQSATAHQACDYGSVLRAALAIQRNNGRAFSLSGTFYNFFHGPDLGAGTFPSGNIDGTADTVQTEGNRMANGLKLGLRLAETGWPDQCDNGANKGFGSAGKTAMCKYYNGAKNYVPNGANNDVKIYWWIIDDRDVGDGCGNGAWGLYDTSGNFKCSSDGGGSGGGSCGNIPSACNDDIRWAVNTGSKSNPEWYPNFYDKTGVQLSAATGEDMIVYWVCSNINPNGNCGGLQLPCGRSCGGSGGGCGNIPSTCNGDIDWAVNTGSKSHPEWYPNFYAKTGVQLSSAKREDMIVYWVCSGINPNGNCNDLELPCGRSCGASDISAANAVIANQISDSCGYIPSTCSGDIKWAVNTGSKTYPEWYPNFSDKTGVQLSSATEEDMVVYWVCSDINPNGNCNGLQIPCGRSCGGSGCGNIPSTCSGDIEWAVNVGSKSNPEWYPNFSDKTGAPLSSATKEDMIVYWVCSGINPNGNCNDLELPCGRSCGGSSGGDGSNTDISDYIGFDLSIGLQSNPLSISKVGEITSNLKGKHYRFYGWNNDDEIAREIIARSSFPNNLKFTIEIPPFQVNSLSDNDIDNLLSTWNDMKQYVYCIQVGNEPLKTGMSFNTLPSKLRMVSDYVKRQNGWNHVVISIPFSADIFDKTYPVKDSVFKSQYKAILTQILQILKQNNSPFSINLYPFFTAMYNPNLLQYCLGNEKDHTGTYESMLAAQYDATLYALNDLISNNGVEVLISETGWATSGSQYSSTTYANQYILSVFNSMNNPSSKLYRVKIFFFELFDEDKKNNGNEPWENHFGFYNLVGSPKYSNIPMTTAHGDAIPFNIEMVTIIIGILLVINMYCVGYYCWHKNSKINNKKKYKVVSFESDTDEEQAFKEYI